MTVNFCAPRTKVLYNTKNLQLKSTPSPDEKFDWIYAHRPAIQGKTASQDAVVIAPIIHDEDCDKILFLKTNRVPITAEGKAKGCIELPAGLIGDINPKETIEDALKKETLEETGYLAEKARIVNPKVASSPGCVSETSTIAVVDITDAKKVCKPKSDNGVIEKRVKVPLKDVDKWIEKQSQMGYIITAQALSGLYYASKQCNVRGDNSQKKDEQSQDTKSKKVQQKLSR